MLEKLQDEVLIIIKKIEEERKREEPRSYLISPLLKQIISLLESFNENSQEAYDFLYKAYVYVAKNYTYIGRFVLSAKYNYIALEFAKKLEKVPQGVSEVLSNLLRDRNYYVDDDCEDVKQLVDGLIEAKTIENLYRDRMNSRRSLKHDPIEMSEEYLAVIDEVEEKIEQNRTVHFLGACHEIWFLKFQYLLEKGITWRSPAVLNPHVMFDW